MYLMCIMNRCNVCCTVKTYSEVADICKKENEESREAKTISKGQTVVKATPIAPGAYRSLSFNPSEITSSVLFCPYCSVQCNRYVIQSHIEKL